MVVAMGGDMKSVGEDSEGYGIMGIGGGIGRCEERERGGILINFIS